MAKLTNSIPYSVLVVVVVLDNFSQRLKTVNVELFDGFHHLCNEHNEIYHLGAEIGNRSDFFLQLVIYQKKFCHSPATLSAKSCLVFAIRFLSIAMFTILESSMHLLAWSKALISSQNLLFWIVDSPGWHLAVQSRVTCDIWCGMVCLKNEIFQQRLVSLPRAWMASRI